MLLVNCVIGWFGYVVGCYNVLVWVVVVYFGLLGLAELVVVVCVYWYCCGYWFGFGGVVCLLFVVTLSCFVVFWVVLRGFGVSVLVGSLVGDLCSWLPVWCLT